MKTSIWFFTMLLLIALSYALCYHFKINVHLWLAILIGVVSSAIGIYVAKLCVDYELRQELKQENRTENLKQAINKFLDKHE